MRWLAIMLLIFSQAAPGICQIFYRFPDKDHQELILKHSNLIERAPRHRNAHTFYNVAEALWQLQRNEEAKKMFLKIMDSELSEYAGTNYHVSDVAGEEEDTRVYAYGSYTSNYKNLSARYLAKIYVEAKDFETALRYVIDADKKYIIHYTCGTGSNFYNAELREIYGLCYEGLNQSGKAIDMLLPYALDWRCETIARILKSKYSSEDIKVELKTAIESITFEVDSTPSTSEVHQYGFGSDTPVIKIITYTSGKGSVDLFGETIPLPRPLLENGEIVTRQHFVEEFMSTRFYKLMTKTVH